MKDINHSFEKIRKDY